MARAMPISPARTPRRAVRGWLSHFSERMNRAAATKYVPVPNQEFAASADSTAGETAKMRMVESASITVRRLPTKHFQHAIGDPETADNVRRCSDNAQSTQYRVKCRFSLSHHLNARDNRDRGDRVRERHQRRVQQRRHAADH